MYGLPDDFDASIFVGRELEQVCFWAYSIHLVFDRDVSVTLESSFSFRSTPDKELVDESIPVRSSDLMILIGRKVEHAWAERNGTLNLSFAGGATLVCLDETKQYESYRIRIADKEIIV